MRPNWMSLESPEPYCCKSPIGFQLPFSYCRHFSDPISAESHTFTRTLKSGPAPPVVRPTSAWTGLSRLPLSSDSEKMLPLILPLNWHILPSDTAHSPKSPLAKRMSGGYLVVGG